MEKSRISIGAHNRKETHSPVTQPIVHLSRPANQSGVVPTCAEETKLWIDSLVDLNGL